MNLVVFFFILQIPVVADLPVGQGLKDHLFVDIPYTVEKPITLTNTESDSWSNYINYYLFGKGKPFSVMT